VQNVLYDHPRAWRVRKNSSRTTPFLALLLGVFTLACASSGPAQEVPDAPMPTISLAQADNFLNQGKTSEALELLKQIAAEDPNTPGLQAKFGKAYFQSRQFAQAISSLKTAREQNPQDLESTQLLALSFYASGSYAQAAPLLEQLGPQLPGSAVDGPYLLGMCYIMTQKWDEARKAFARMFSVKPESGAAYLMLGKILVHQKLEDRAVPQVEKAIELDARLPMAHFLLGEIDLYKGNPEAAVLEFRKELEINPTVWLVYWRLGDAYLRLEKYGEAEKVLKEAIWLNESSSGAYILLGKIALKKDQYDVAAGFLERALKLDPQNYYVHYLLGKAYQKLGRDAEAVRHFAISDSLRKDKQNDEREMMQAVP